MNGDEHNNQMGEGKEAGSAQEFLKLLKEARTAHRLYRETSKTFHADESAENQRPYDEADQAWTAVCERLSRTPAPSISLAHEKMQFGLSVAGVQTALGLNDKLVANEGLELVLSAADDFVRLRLGRAVDAIDALDESLHRAETLARALSGSFDLEECERNPRFSKCMHLTPATMVGLSDMLLEEVVNAKTARGGLSL